MAGTATRSCCARARCATCAASLCPAPNRAARCVVDLDLPAGPLRIVAAHLGLLRRSRRWQVRSILDAIEEGPRMPTLLVGDLNEWRPGRRSSLHELRPLFGPLIHAHFSFPSYFPVIALDRVIGSPGLVTAMEVHDSDAGAGRVRPPAAQGDHRHSGGT